MLHIELESLPVKIFEVGQQPLKNGEKKTQI